jgi:GNAT superfamily N-acetyltransferase
MKTSTFFACGVPENERDLHMAMISGIETEKEYSKDYGLVKALYEKTGECIAVGGLIRRKEYAENKFIVEGVIFLKPEYIGSGIGFWLEKIYFEKAENLGAIFVVSIWEKNTASIKLVEKNNMVYKGSFFKTYNKNVVKVNMYIKFPSNIIIPDEFLNIEQFFTCSKISSLDGVQNM